MMHGNYLYLTRMGRRRCQRKAFRPAIRTLKLPVNENRQNY